jgi:RNA polymerase sigma-70 factor (ECF subfamily)
MDALLAEEASGGGSAQDRRRLDAHLPGCARCRAELALYEEALGLVRENPARCPPGGDDLVSSTLRLWRRTRRRRAAAIVSGALAAAAALALAPGLLREQAPRPAQEALVATWEPDVDGALEASGLVQDLDDAAETTTVDVALAAFDAAEP